MKRIITIIVTLFITTFSLQAECVFESFAVGEDFAIGNMLEWTTSEEIDNEQFLIEKSTDGISYEQIGEVNAMGTSEDFSNYRFLDLDARKGLSFYRVKQVDYDGDYSYSKIVIVNKATENNIMITSINDKLKGERVELTVDVTKPLTLEYAIKDMKNDVIQKQTINAQQGLQNIVFDLSAYPNGMYKLSLISGEEEETINFRKTNAAENTKVPVASK